MINITKNLIIESNKILCLKNENNYGDLQEEYKEKIKNLAHQSFEDINNLFEDGSLSKKDLKELRVIKNTMSQIEKIVKTGTTTKINDIIHSLSTSKKNQTQPN